MLNVYTYQARDKSGWANFVFKYVHVISSSEEKANERLLRSYPIAHWNILLVATAPAEDVLLNGETV